jgi:hypothetical protein
MVEYDRPLLTLELLLQHLDEGLKLMKVEVGVTKIPCGMPNGGCVVSQMPYATLYQSGRVRDVFFLYLLSCSRLHFRVAKTDC